MGIRILRLPLLLAVMGMMLSAQPLPAATVSLGAGVAGYHHRYTGWVLPLAYAPGNGRYEFGLTWFSRQYQRPRGGSGLQDLKINLAPGQFVATFSRRWVMRRDRRVQPLFALGFAYLSAQPCDGEPSLPPPAPKGSVSVACNYLLGTHLNFTEQIGLRVPLDTAHNWHLELTGRHISNGGLDRLNRGQDALQAVFQRQLR